MRISIVLDDKLVQEAFCYAAVSSKRELVQLVLREFVDNHRRLDVRDLKGTVSLRLGACKGRKKPLRKT